MEINATDVNAALAQPEVVLSEPGAASEAVDEQKKTATADHAAYERSRRIGLLKLVN